MQVTARYDPHEWIHPGDSVMADPEQTGVLTAEMDLDRPRRDRTSVDVAGHHGRPDIFWLTVDRHRARRWPWRTEPIDGGRCWT